MTSADPQPPDDLTEEELRLLATPEEPRAYRPGDGGAELDEPPPGPAGVSPKPPPRRDD